MSAIDRQDEVAERAEVAEVLDRLRSSVRQRQAELTTTGSTSDELRLRLAELQSSEFVDEPVCVSPRPVVGRLLVATRKAVFHLFLKWYLRPLLMQVNRFHSVAGSLLRDLVEANRRLAVENQELERRIRTLETASDGREG